MEEQNIMPKIIKLPIIHTTNKKEEMEETEMYDSSLRESKQLFFKKKKEVKPSAGLDSSFKDQPSPVMPSIGKTAKIAIKIASPNIQKRTQDTIKSIGSTNSQISRFQKNVKEGENKLARMKSLESQGLDKESINIQQNISNTSNKHIEIDGVFKYQSLTHYGKLTSLRIESLYKLFLDENSLKVSEANSKQKSLWVHSFYKILKHILEVVLPDDQEKKVNLLTFVVSCLISLPVDIGIESNSEDQLLKIINLLKLENEKSRDVIQKQTQLIVDLHERIRLIEYDLNNALDISVFYNPKSLVDSTVKIIERLEKQEQDSMKVYLELEEFSHINRKLKESYEKNLGKLYVRKSIFRGPTPKGIDLSYKFYDSGQVDEGKRVIRKLKSHSVENLDRLGKNKKGATFSNLVKKNSSATQTDAQGEFKDSYTQTEVSLSSPWFDNFLVSQEDANESNKTVKLCKKIEKFAKRDEISQSRGKLESFLMSFEGMEDLEVETQEAMQREILALLSNYSKEIMSNRELEKKNDSLKALSIHFESKCATLLKTVKMLDSKLVKLGESTAAFKKAHSNCVLTSTAKKIEKAVNLQQQMEGFTSYISTISTISSYSDTIKPTSLNSKTRSAYKLVNGFFASRCSQYKKRISGNPSYEEPPFIQSFYSYLSKITSSGGSFDLSKLKEYIISMVRCQSCVKVQVLLRFLHVSSIDPLPLRHQVKYLVWLVALEEYAEGVDVPVDNEACRHYIPIDRYKRLLREVVAMEDTDGKTADSILSEIESISVVDPSNRNVMKVLDYDDFIMTVFKYLDKQSSLSLFHYSNVFDTIDLSRSGGLSLHQILSFYRMFYMHNKDMCHRIMYCRIRFLFYFYLDRSLIKQHHICLDDEFTDLLSHRDDDIDIFSSNENNNLSSGSNACLLDDVKIGRTEFNYLCMDIKIFTSEEYFSSFVALPKDRYEDEYNYKSNLFLKEREIIEEEVGRMDNISNEKKAEFKINLDYLYSSIFVSQSTNSQSNNGEKSVNKNSTKKKCVVFLIQYRILMDQYYCMKELDSQGNIHILSISTPIYLLDSPEKEIISELRNFNLSNSHQH